MDENVLDLSVAPSTRRDDFIVTSANSLAFQILFGGGNWPDGRLILVGEAKSGKSHLASIWATERGAELLMPKSLSGERMRELLGGMDLVVEDADAVARDPDREVALFHLCNAAAAAGRKLLLTARANPSAWGIRLNDLRSRMEGSRTAVLGPPDDDLLQALLVKLLSDRQIAVSARILKFVVPRMTRSYAAAFALVDELDRLSLSAGRPATMAMATMALEKHSGR